MAFCDGASNICRALRIGLASQRAYSPILSAHTDALVFPYMRDSEMVNIKYRGREVAFETATAVAASNTTSVGTFAPTALSPPLPPLPAPPLS